MSAWVLSLLLLLAPPDRLAALPAFPGWAETAAERRARYVEIAEAMAAATKDPREMAALVAVAFHESGFAKDVDLGPCFRGPRNDGGRCDGGRAVTIYQIRADGDDARKLWADRHLAARVAQRAIRRSAKACVPKHGAEAALRVYASGSCSRGIQESTAMVRLARKLLAEHPPPKESPHPD